MRMIVSIWLASSIVSFDEDNDQAYLISDLVIFLFS